ncbi:MAG: c-type cytochrome [Flavisolibacter sp.]
MKLLRPLLLVVLGIVLTGILVVWILSEENTASEKKTLIADLTSGEWIAPDINSLPQTPEGDLIRYGRELISRTAFYLGPKGTVAAITNGMNCQNCHLDGGTKSFGNNYSAVASTYPQFRPRSGTIENAARRVSDCLERSLNASGKIDTNSREVQAMVAYMNWLGKDVPEGLKPTGAGIKELPILSRAADPLRGETVYVQNCQRCHGVTGEGLISPDFMGFTYPPLWGENSYTTAAGLYRISHFAGFVRLNMPFDAPQNARQLTDEEAWDVAAFVNSKPRPQKVFRKDWPDVSVKPFDYPFGPYADSFPQAQHKFGPFETIIAATKKR